MNSELLSIVHGRPLADEPGMGALTIPGYLREVTARHRDREALVMHSEHGVERWSYQMLWDKSVEVAKALIACGVSKDSRVGVLMTNRPERSEEHTSELQSLMRISYAVFCLKKKNNKQTQTQKKNTNLTNNIRNVTHVNTTKH